MTFFNILIGSIMTVSFIGMIICAKKQHGHAMAKPGAIALLLVVVSCAGMILYKNMGGGSSIELLANERKYSKAQTYVLGKELGEQMPGMSVLLLVAEKDPSVSGDSNDALIQGLKEGFGNSIFDIKTVPVKLATQDSEGSITAKEFNAILAENKTRNIIISMVGLPDNKRDLSIWKAFKDDPITCPKLVVVGGDISRMGALIHAGLMPAVVVPSPEADWSSPTPETLTECFAKRYILITKKNLEEIVTKYPNKIFLTK